MEGKTPRLAIVYASLSCFDRLLRIYRFDVLGGWVIFDRFLVKRERFHFFEEKPHKKPMAKMTN
jgi:hypothetical protein